MSLTARSFPIGNCVFKVSKIKPIVALHIKTSHLVCSVNQLTFFYEMQHWAEMVLY